MKNILLVAIVAMIAVTGSAILSAHPTASSFVVVTVDNNRLATVTITADTASLLLKLDGKLPELTRQVTLETDRGPLTTEFGHAVARENGRSQVTLTALLPEDATTLRWRSTLFVGAYPVALRAGATAAALAADDYEWLSNDDWSSALALQSARDRNPGAQVFSRMVALGFTHILPGGLDHVLFVLGLFLLASGTRALLLQITAFTLAHSTTLALASIGVVTVPAAIVEPLIALSIAYVAIENMVATTLSRSRLAIIFAFGLLHGLGFAGAFQEMGAGTGGLAMTLAGFKLGVELGQRAVVGLDAIVMRLIPVPEERRRKWVAAPASAAIAAMGVTWAVERVI